MFKSNSQFKSFTLATTLIFCLAPVSGLAERDLIEEGIERGKAILARNSHKTLSHTERLNYYATATGLDKNHPRLREFTDQFRQRTFDAESPLHGSNIQIAVPPESKVPSDLAVVKHLRAEGGIPFADAAEYQKVYHARLKKSIEEQRSIEKVKSNTIEESDYEPPAFERCKSTKTTRQRTGYSGPEDRAKRVQFDYLFVDIDDFNGMMKDRRELVGDKVNFRIFGADQAGVEATARGFNVQCLPTRIRSTRQYIFKQTGGDALRNYDKDPHGKGVAHPLMEEVIKGYRK